MLYVAIAIIERGTERGDVTTIKSHALQLGYLCCERLKDNQKQKEFEHRMSEMSISFPLTDNTVNQVRTCKHTKKYYKLFIIILDSCWPYHHISIVS